MKTLKCDLCEHEVQGETFEEWMKAPSLHGSSCRRNEGPEP
jgi:hypothetical protein